jgi:hypothetical protein
MSKGPTQEQWEQLVSRQSKGKSAEQFEPACTAEGGGKRQLKGLIFGPDPRSRPSALQRHAAQWGGGSGLMTLPACPLRLGPRGRSGLEFWVNSSYA